MHIKAAAQTLLSNAHEARDFLGGLNSPLPGGGRWASAYHTALRVEALALRLIEHHATRDDLVEMPPHGEFPIRQDGPLSLAEIYLLLRDAQDLRRVFRDENLAGEGENHGARAFASAVTLAAHYGAVVPVA